MSWGTTKVDSNEPVYRVAIDESLDQFTSAQYDKYVANFDPNRSYYDDKPVDFETWAKRLINRAHSIGLTNRMWNSKGTAVTYSRKATKDTGVKAWVEVGTISWSKV